MEGDGDGQKKAFVFYIVIFSMFFLENLFKIATKFSIWAHFGPSPKSAHECSLKLLYTAGLCYVLMRSSHIYYISCSTTILYAFS